MVATSDERVYWPQPSRTSRTLGDIFDAPEEVEGEWFDAESKPWFFEHCRKQTKKGNGFEAVRVAADSESVKGVTKRYLSGRGDNTVIEHPTRPGVVRFFTLSELRKLFGVPADFQLPAKTVAGEIIGQGVIVPLFQKIIEAATGRAAGIAADEPQVVEVFESEGQLALAF
jgi:hypothetical protein